ncbi:MAG: MmgE/PrpD family protein, partial [Candidatus Latescibacteria bacterium]|nr:MmgE/PrpD family protein [Candidatus Latescibacterota bacterium]
LITAIVIGYEVQCRLCDAASIRSRGWDHVTYGAFSTSLVAAKLMGLSEEEIHHALGLSGTPNIALRQTRAGELSMWKGCAFANASRNGVFAATLSKHGMTGPAPIFEGVFGFQKLVSGPFALAPFGGSGHPFKILDTSIKHFPVEYHAQSAVEAALALRKEIGDVTRIERIHVETFNAAVQIIAGEPEKWHPKSRETADHSLPYCIAVALMDGEVGLRQFDEDRIADPVLHDLIQKVEVVESAELSQAYPEGIPNDISITTVSGERYRKRVDYPLGHDKNPMVDEEVEEKFRKLVQPYLPPRRVDRILQKLWHLEEVMEIGEVLELFAIG